MLLFLQSNITCAMYADVCFTQHTQAMCADMAKKCRAKAGGSSKPGADGAERVEPRVHLKCFLGTGDFLFSGPEGVMCMLNMRTIDARYVCREEPKPGEVV